MDILEIQIYRGANYWAPMPAIRLVIDEERPDECSAKTIPGLCEKLFSAVPTLRAHRCSGVETGNLFEGVRRGTCLFHVAEHLAVELQILAGEQISSERMHAVPQETCSGMRHVVFGYEEAEVGVVAGKLALRLLRSFVDPECDSEFRLDIQLEELIQLAKELRQGIDTRQLKEEAGSRGIPVEYLDEHRKVPRPGTNSRRHSSLMQLGQGKFQKRIWAPYVSTDSFIAAEVASNKELTSTVLRKTGLPVPRSNSVADEDGAAQAAREIGYPVVLKPLDGSQGRGVGAYLQDEAAVRRHYPIALRAT